MPSPTHRRRPPNPNSSRHDRRRKHRRIDLERARGRVPRVRARLPREALMSGAAWAQLLALIGLLAISTPLLGSYLAKVYGGEHAPRDRGFPPPERVVYRLCSVSEDTEHGWTTYAMSLLAFSFASVLVLYAQIRLQGHLPFNPDHMKDVGPALSFNTSVSFLTNTNWQNYAGESAMSHLTQMAGLAVHNFVSAAAGAAVGGAPLRGPTPRRAHTNGQFSVAIARTATHPLLPLPIA